MAVANLCNLRFFANKFVCTVMTDHFKGFAEKRYTCTFYDDACLKKIDFFKITIGCNFLQIYLCDRSH